MKSRILTVEQLKAAGACQDGIDSFLKVFPSGSVKVSVKAAKKVAGKLNFDWARTNLLSPNGKKKFIAARKPLDDEYIAAIKPLDDEYYAAIKPLTDTYEAAINPLDDEYIAAIKPLTDEYYAARKSLTDAYWAARKPLDDAYLAATKPLEDAYNAAVAATFAEIYIEDACNL